MDPALFSWGPLIVGAAPIGGLYAPVSDEAAAGTLAAAWEAGSGLSGRQAADRRAEGAAARCGAAVEEMR